jgi:curved DNA-binding protein CbpA
MTREPQRPDHYATLGVPRDAAPASIKAAYRRASAAAHPDRDGGSDEAMAAINQAYEVLGDPKRRAAYDAGGSGRAEASLEDLARSMLVSMAESAIRTVDVNIVEAMQRMVDMARDSGQGEIRTLKRRVARLNDRRGTVRRKGDGENLVHALIDQQLRAAETQIQQTSEVLAALEIAQLMLGDYESVPGATRSDPSARVDDAWSSLLFDYAAR